ncbi:MAG: pimeloyl-ACP methyl ester carboxylesterase [Candidatus Aldehydirespiratoraceae bacterium]|jgi:pimeloyl-ACP methyl ester carboxylesterase
MVGKMDFETREHQGRNVRFASVGEGTPVVLLHGFPDGPESWEKTAAALAEAGHRAIVPYLRGYHPDTIHPGRGYTRTEFADDVVHLLDSIGLDDAVLVGHDWGAAYVWSTLGAYPERVRAVVPIGIPHPACLKPSMGLLWGVRHFFYFKAPASDWRAARRHFAYVEQLYSRWSPNWTGVDRDTAVARIKEIFVDPAVLHEALEYYRDLSFKPDPASDFRSSCPALIVAGSDDFDGNLGPYEASVARFEDSARLLVIDGAGHWPHREGESEFIQELVALVDNVSSL